MSTSTMMIFSLCVCGAIENVGLDIATVTRHQPEDKVDQAPALGL
jgi:hypothetical protein